VATQAHTRIGRGPPNISVSVSRFLMMTSSVGRRMSTGHGFQSGQWRFIIGSPKHMASQFDHTDMLCSNLHSHCVPFMMADATHSPPMQSRQPGTSGISNATKCSSQSHPTLRKPHRLIGHAWVDAGRFFDWLQAFASLNFIGCRHRSSPCLLPVLSFSRAVPRFPSIAWLRCCVRHRANQIQALLLILSCSDS
jgi:hypothetical protein